MSLVTWKKLTKIDFIVIFSANTSERNRRLMTMLTTADVNIWRQWHHPYSSTATLLRQKGGMTNAWGENIPPAPTELISNVAPRFFPRICQEGHSSFWLSGHPACFRHGASLYTAINIPHLFGFYFPHFPHFFSEFFFNENRKLILKLRYSHGTCIFERSNDEIKTVCVLFLSSEPPQALVQWA